MPLPSGISTCTVTFGKALGLLGTEGSITGTLVADRTLIWAATGQTVYPYPEPVASDLSGTVTMQVPHVDQAGFRDASGAACTSWALVFEGTVVLGDKAYPVRKPFQVFVGQTNVDLDLVPDGSISPAVTAPTQPVTSVNGQTGAVTISGGIGTAATRTASATATSGALNPFDASSGAITVTPPAVGTQAAEFGVQKTDATTNPVTITFTNLRGAAATIALTSQGESRRYVSRPADGSWWPIGDHRTPAQLDRSYGTPDYRGVVLAGQSNEAGATTDGDPLIDTTTARIKQWSRSLGRIRTALEPMEHFGANSTLATAIGPGITLAKGIDSPNQPPVLLIPGARGSTGFVPAGGYTWDVDDTTAANNLGRQLVADMKAAAAFAKVRFDIFHWTQGENDTSLTADQYAAKFDRLISYIKQQVPEAANLVVIVHGMVPKGIAGASGRQNITVAHRETPYRTTGSAFVYSPEGPDTHRTDDVGSVVPIHFTAATQRQRGTDAAAAYQFALLNRTGVDPYPPAAVAPFRYGTTIYAEITPSPGRVTDYNVAYSTDGGTTWTDVTAARSLQLRRSVLDGASSGNIMVRARTVNEVGTSAWTTSANVTVASLIAVPSTLLTGGTVFTGAFGLRKLVAAYAGPAVKVRTTGGTLTDIGFRADGSIDEAALTAAAAGGDLTIDTLYDQSGNGRHFIQTTVARQPFIVSGGSIWKINGRVSLRMGTAAAYRMSGSTPYLTAAGSATSMAVFTERSASATGTFQYVSEFGSTAQYTPFAINASNQLQQIISDDAGAFTSQTGLTGVTSGGYRQWSAVDTGTSLRNYQDGDAAPTAVTYSRSGRAFTMTSRSLGNASITSSSFYFGELLEVGGTVLSDTVRRSIEANQRDYWATLGKLVAV